MIKIIDECEDEWRKSFTERAAVRAKTFSRISRSIDYDEER